MIVGRTAELAEIDRLLAGARAGDGGALILRGEAGIGKSALIEYTAEATQGARVLRAAAHPSEAGQPFAALELLLRPLDARLGVLQDAYESGITTVAERFRVRRAVLALLSEQAVEQPLLCLVDDAQWVDPASADVLAFAARRFGGLRVALLLGARDGDPFMPSGVAQRQLGRLEPAAALQALRAWQPALAPPVLERVVAESKGNPLALRELAASLSAEQRAGRLNPFAFHDGATSVVSTVQEEFRARIAALPAPTQTLLLVVAAGDDPGLGRVTAAAEALGARLADLGPAERAGLVQVVDTAVTFPHPLMRAAAYDNGTTADRKAAHRALAETAGAEHQDLRAWNLSAAMIGHDEEVASGLAVIAGRSCGWHAYAGYARAAQLTPGRPQRARRLTAAARMAGHTGLLDAALELAGQAAELTGDPVIRAELAQVTAAVEFERGSPRVAGRKLIDGAALLGELDPAEALLMLAEAVRCGWHVSDIALMREAEAAIGKIPLPPGSPLTSLRPALSAVIASLPGGPPGDGGLVCALAKAARHSLPAELNERLMATSIGLAIGSGGGSEGAQRFVAECRAQGLAGRLPYALQLLAHAQMFRGRYPEATTAAAEGLQLATAAGQLHRESQLRCLLGWLAAVEGDEERCSALVADGMEYAAGQGAAPALALGGWALALLDLGHGRNEPALVRLERLAFSDSGMGTILRAPDQIEAAVKCGQPERAISPLLLLEEWVTHSGHTLAAAVALRCRALICPGDEAGRYFAAAVSMHGEIEQPYAWARTELSYGEWLRRGQRRAEARAHLNAAAEAFERLGAGVWADRARAELAATGDVGHTPHGDALTPQERQVVRLAAGGASNKDIAARLFLSPRTVGNHLYRAFRKLGVRNRAGLAELDLDLRDDSTTAPG